VFLFSISLAFGQKTTIFEYFELEKQDCLHKMKEQFEPGTAVVFDESVSIPNPLSPPIANENTTENETYLTELRKLKLAIADLPNFEKTRFTLANGDYPFRKGKLWGMKNSRGKVQVKPKFTQIYGDKTATYSIDKSQNGYVGCIGAKCNYYRKNKKVLPKDWFYIKRINSSTFIVRGKQGYGVQVNKKMLITPDKSRIRHNVFGQYSAFYFYDKTKRITTVITNEGDSYFINGFIEEIEYLGKDYILLNGELIHRTTKKMLLCDEGFTISIFNVEHKLFLLENKNKVYLIDSEGNMIYERSFKKIRNHPDNGHYLVEGYDEGGGSRLNRGLLNGAGQMVVPLKYKYAESKFDYFFVTNHDGESGVLDSLGNVLIPFDRFRTQPINDSLIYRAPIPELTKTKVIQLPKGNTLADSLDLARLHREYFCDGEIFHAVSGKGQKETSFYVDKNFQRIGKTNITSRIFDLKNRGVWHFKDTKMKDGVEYYTCDGQQFSLMIDGEKVTIFQGISLLRSGCHLVRLLNGDSYFLLKDKRLQKIEFPFGRTAHFSISAFTLIANKETNKWGLFDERGKPFLPPIFDHISTSYGGQYLRVAVGQDFVQYVDMEGNLILENYPQVKEHLTANLFLIEEGGKKGVVDDAGNIIVPTSYKYCDRIGGLLNMSNGDGVFLYSYEGELIGKIE
jgi:hypothetical protein